MTYAIRASSEINANVELAAQQSNEVILKFKNKDKKSYFFTAPELTDNFVTSFINSGKGMEAVKDYIDSLRKGVAKSKFDAGQHFTEYHCSCDALAEFALMSSENVRLTKENILKAFEESWKNIIAFALVLERDAAGSVVLGSENAEAIVEYWNSEAGQKWITIAGNYKQFFLYGAERAPTFSSQELKDKVLTAVSYLPQEEQLVQKLVTKLTDAPIASVDLVAL